MLGQGKTNTNLDKNNQPIKLLSTISSVGNYFPIKYNNTKSSAVNLFRLDGLGVYTVALLRLDSVGIDVCHGLLLLGPLLSVRLAVGFQVFHQKVIRNELLKCTKNIGSSCFEEYFMKSFNGKLYKNSLLQATLPRNRLDPKLSLYRCVSI